jgi:S1-C subfamily serine protease
LIFQSFNHNHVNEAVVGVPKQNIIKPVNNIKYNEPMVNESLPSLTYASEKTVKTVAHIQTQFTKEQITYDPFLKLFYGQDAYRKRELHGSSAGSGVVISANGYIVTNNHVVQDAHTITVTLNEKQYKAQLIGTDPSTDIAVIKVDAQGLDFTEFSNSDDLKLGEWVLAVGNPLNLQTTVTAGIVSAKNRNIDLLTSNYNPDENIFPIESFIQTDAAVNSGNSGGALVNQKGDLVGINTAIASGNGFYTGYSFAVPSNIVKKVTQDLIAFGEVKRVRLGINITDNNESVQNELNLTSSEGIVVMSIVEGGIASKYKLKSKDIIVGLDNEKVTSSNEFQAKMSLYNPGDQVELTVLRGNNTKSIQIILE